jgi:hypothetical protein
MVISAGKKSGSRWRTERSGMKLVEPKAVASYPFDCGHWHRTAECFRRAETNIIKHDEQDVGSFL